MDTLRICVATDGSAQAERAVRLVAGLAWPQGTRIRVVRVIADATALLGAAADAEMLERIEAEMTGTLQAAADALAAPGRTVERAVVRGGPAATILDDARAYGADLIVVGHRGTGQLAALLLGSTAAEIVERAQCPVLVARSSDVGPILLADDGSEPSLTAVRLVAEWPAFRGIPVRVVGVAHAFEPLAAGIAPTLRSAAHAEYAADLAAATADLARTTSAALDLLRSRGFRAYQEVRSGDAVSEILDAAREMGAGLIVVGTRGLSGIHALLGSVARGVVLRAHCSVLVVRPPEQRWSEFGR